MFGNLHGVKWTAPADTLPLLLSGSYWLIMVAWKPKYIRESRRSAVLDLVAECDERSGNSEVLAASKFGDCLNSEDLAEHLIVPFHEARQRGRRRR
jgi:hypothetical protein